MGRAKRQRSRARAKAAPLSKKSQSKVAAEERKFIESCEQIVKDLRNPDKEVKKQAAEAIAGSVCFLSRVGIEDAEVAQASTESGFVVDKSGAIKLAKNGGVKYMIPLIFDEDPAVIEAAVGALRNFAAIGAEVCDIMVAEDIINGLLTSIKRFASINIETSSPELVLLTEIIALLRNLCVYSEKAVIKMTMTLDEDSSAFPILFGSIKKTTCLQFLLIVSQFLHVVSDQNPDLLKHLPAGESIETIHSQILAAIEPQSDICDNVDKTMYRLHLAGVLLNMESIVALDRVVQALSPLLSNIACLHIDPSSITEDNVMETLQKCEAVQLSLELMANINSSCIKEDEEETIDSYPMRVSLLTDAKMIENALTTLQSAIGLSSVELFHSAISDVFVLVHRSAAFLNQTFTAIDSHKSDPRVSLSNAPAIWDVLFSCLSHFTSITPEDSVKSLCGECYELLASATNNLLSCSDVPLTNDHLNAIVAMFTANTGNVSIQCLALNMMTLASTRVDFDSWKGLAQVISGALDDPSLEIITCAIDGIFTVFGENEEPRDVIFNEFGVPEKLMRLVAMIEEQGNPEFAEVFENLVAFMEYKNIQA